jgi:hypothetical protein
MLTKGITMACECNWSYTCDMHQAQIDASLANDKIDELAKSVALLQKDVLEMKRTLNKLIESIDGTID